MSEYAVKQRKVVGVFRQTLILFWKNSLLFRRNISGTIAEILVAFIFVLILLLLRYFIDTPHYQDQTNTNLSNPVLNVASFVNDTSGRYNILYYPNNDFISDIMKRAKDLIIQANPKYVAACKLKSMLITRVVIWIN